MKWNNLEALFTNCINTELSETLSVSESNALINAMPLLVMIALLGDLLHINLIERLFG